MLQPRPRALLLAFAFLACSALPGVGQEKGAWRAVSRDAIATTGDIAFSDVKVAINFSTYTIAQIRSVTPAEARAVFDIDPEPGAAGNLYRLAIPAGKQFLHRKTLCGAEDTQWILTWVTGKHLQLAFFWGPNIPTLTPEAMMTSSTLCGSYEYVR